MSESSIVRFPGTRLPSENHAEAAEHARRRIANLPDAYMAHATPSKEDLVGVVEPVSPAAEAGTKSRGTTTTPAMSIKAPDPVASPKYSVTNESHELPEEPDEPKRRLRTQLLPLFTGIFVFALLSLLFEAPIFLNQFGYLTHPKAAAPAVAQAAAEVPPDPAISIPKINVNAPVVYATSNDENAILTDLQSGVVHYANTALPGQAGNSVIFGHSSNDWWEAGNYKFVFVLLDKLVPGDTFTVNYQSHQYVYQVTSTEVVDPTDVGVLNPTSDAEMTLITCSPPGTSWKRLIVHSKLTSPASGGKAAAPQNTTGPGTLPSNSPGITDAVGTWWQQVVSFFSGKGPAAPKTTPTNPASIPATQ